MQKIYPFLSFKDNSSEVMDFYKTVFKDSEIKSKTPYPDNPNLLINGHMIIKEMEFFFLDIGDRDTPVHGWGTSYYINLDTEEEFFEIYNFLKIDGKTMMGPEEIPGFKLVTWIVDKFGVTWQLTVK